MAYIRIDLSSIPVNGQTVTFKSPANCHLITGLKVYYPDGHSTSQMTLQFADAHGNNVGGRDLFASNVLVKVILDTDSNRAFVQNADTNSYLEGRFEELAAAGKLFIADLYETSYADLEAAYNAGKTMVLKVDGHHIPFDCLEGLLYTFRINRYGTYYNYWCSPDYGWKNNNVPLPIVHASKHAKGGADPITPDMIGAARIATGYFVGANGPVELSFDFKPKRLIITGSSNSILFASSLQSGDENTIYHRNGSDVGHDSVTITVSGNTVTLSSGYLSSTGNKYFYTAFG